MKRRLLNKFRNSRRKLRNESADWGLSSASAGVSGASGEWTRSRASETLPDGWECHETNYDTSWSQSEHPEPSGDSGVTC